jgi:uncharacterized protein (TIGR02996 family)
MTDRDALLAAIRERLDDDLPRLVFADWLDEQGETELADFIRLDVTSASLPEDDPRRIEYVWHEKARLEQRPSVQAHLPVLPSGARWLGPPYFVRGFPRCVEINFSHAAAAPSRVAYELTTTTHLVARVGSWPIDGLLQSPWTASLRTLDLIGYPLPWVPLARLCRHPFPNLRSLNLFQDAIAFRTIDLIVESPIMDRLEQFSVVNIPCARRVVDALISRGTTLIRHLSLHRTRMPGDILLNLLHSRSVQNLETLQVGGDYTATGTLFQAVGQSPIAHQLKSLITTGSVLGFSGAESLAHSPSLTELRTLGLSACVVHAPEMRRLASSHNFRQLAVLDLSRNPLGDEGLTYLCSSGSFPALKVLDLRFAQLSDVGAQRILESDFAERLTWLNLANNTFSGAMKLKLERKFGTRVIV